MATQHLLHTNIASFIIRTDIRVIRRLNETMPSKIAISAVTEAELLFGVRRKRDAFRLNALVQQFLSSCQILAWTSAAAHHFAYERAILEKKGQMLSDMDMMIAAHALAEDAVLVTNDAAFRRIDRLRIEDWTT
ncbi:MAG TPA: type II toxin-antitoxin system VapC family toxin [Silvibacterium sp.]|nr:type II toxin-antitoxin system VapC family toxin [Silvibacterium sp.]